MLTGLSLYVWHFQIQWLESATNTGQISFWTHSNNYHNKIPPIYEHIPHCPTYEYQYWFKGYILLKEFPFWFSEKYKIIACCDRKG